MRAQSDVRVLGLATGAGIPADSLRVVEGGAYGGRGRPVTHQVPPGGRVLQKLVPESLHRPHPLRGQHRLPGAQLLVLQPSPPQFSQLLQPQFLIGRVPRHVAAGTPGGNGAPPDLGPVTAARSRWAERPCEDAWERRAVMTPLWSADAPIAAHGPGMRRACAHRSWGGS